MERTGAQLLLDSLEDHDVDTIFGYPGGAVIPLYDALYDRFDRFNHYLTAHEQGAIHGADGYARATGNVGVAFATSGPGATNTITGIATAYMDSVPLVVITGQVPRSLLGRDSFQEVDITGITLPITKHNFLVQDIKDLQVTMNKAFEIARAGRPGPVLVDIPKDVFNEKYHRENYVESSNTKEVSVADSTCIASAIEMINNAKRPVIYGGGGVVISNTSEELRTLATKGGIPVVNTLMGLGTIDRSSDLSLGMVGMHGSKEANLSVSNCDLLIAIGARFSDRVIGKASKFANKAKVIHIDIDKTEINKNINVDLSLLGDVKANMNLIIDGMESKSRDQWYEQIASWKHDDSDELLRFTPKTILNTANEFFKDSIVVTDTGQHQMWSAQHWKCKEPRTFLTSGGLGTMGFGLGAALGAKVGKMDKRVIHVTGDGSFRMNCNELVTASKYKIPTISLVFNNGALGMVRQWQKLFKDGRFSETILGNDVDFVKLAEAYNIKGFRAKNKNELEAALEYARLNDKEPVLIDCIILQDENVYPMVPAGESIENLILG